MAGNEIKFTLAGDSKSLERSFDRAGSAAKDMASDLKDADKAAGKFSGGVSSLNDKIDQSESKFMGTADLVDGLSSAMGISLGPTVDYARAFGDIAGGFTATLGPAMESITGKIGKLSVVTKIQTGVQSALNAVMAANPILLVVLAVAALTAGFILAYKKSETFRKIVDGAMSGVRNAIGWVGDKVGWLSDKIGSLATDAGKKLAGIAKIITTPYRLAFNGVAWAWNNTVGKLSFSIPGWVPGIGGSGFDVPDMPTVPALARGGTARGGMPHLVGEMGPELFVPRSTGTVIPNGGFGTEVTFRFERGAGDAMMTFLRTEVRKRGGLDKAFA
jgi:hypothetical protein